MEEREREGDQIGETDKKVKMGKRCKVGKINEIAKHRKTRPDMVTERTGRKLKNMVLHGATICQGARAASIMLR